MMLTVRSLLLAALSSLLLGVQLAQADALDRTPVEATTARGEKVRLFPNGRWEYVDAVKAEAAKQQAEQYPENKTRPVEAQGGMFGVGRVILPGDKEYNRGSLNPKMR